MITFPEILHKQRRGQHSLLQIHLSKLFTRCDLESILVKPHVRLLGYAATSIFFGADTSCEYKELLELYMNHVSWKTADAALHGIGSPPLIIFILLILMGEEIQLHHQDNRGVWGCFKPVEFITLFFQKERKSIVYSNCIKGAWNYKEKKKEVI